MSDHSLCGRPTSHQPFKVTRATERVILDENLFAFSVVVSVHLLSLLFFVLKLWLAHGGVRQKYSSIVCVQSEALRQS